MIMTVRDTTRAHIQTKDYFDFLYLIQYLHSLPVFGRIRTEISSLFFFNRIFVLFKFNLVVDHHAEGKKMWKFLERNRCIAFPVAYLQRNFYAGYRHLFKVHSPKVGSTQSIRHK